MEKGSSKKTKKRRKDTISLHEEGEEIDSERVRLVSGLERDHAFKFGELRHMIYRSSLRGMLKEFSATKARPSLLLATDSYKKYLFSHDLRKQSHQINGKIVALTPVDFSFISLPSNL